MAKKRSGTGLVTVRQMRGLGQISNPRSWMGAIAPPLAGGAVAGLTFLATRHFAKPAESETQRQLYRWAPAVGIGAGLFASLAMYWVAGAPGAVSSAVSAVMVGGAAMAFDYLLKDRMGDQALAMADATTAPTGNGTSGFGVVVPQRIAGAGTRGILMEPAASRDPVRRYGLSGQYGEDVNLGGSVNPGAFGTPGFGTR